ncbi:MAG: DinB family protein [Ignavibacteria bacterium]|nr:DinB family protein [Ignavibacteria bacterium]
MEVITRPLESDIPSYYLNYTKLAEGNDLIKTLDESNSITLDLLKNIPVSKEDYAYAAGKWSIKQVMSHIIDSERVFAYRALRFSRRDATVLPGFEENDYAENANVSGRNLDDIKNEYLAVRDSTIQLYRYMTTDMLDFKGFANEVSVTARAIGWIIAGHNVHHCNVIKDRYL